MRRKFIATEDVAAMYRSGDCTIEVTPATRRHAAVWFVTRGQRQKDGIATTTTAARRDARAAAAKLGCGRRRSAR